MKRIKTHSEHKVTHKKVAKRFQVGLLAGVQLQMRRIDTAQLTILLHEDCEIGLFHEQS